MDKNERFTDQAFEKVTDKKVIEKAQRRAEELRAQVAPKAEDKKIS